MINQYQLSKESPIVNLSLAQINLLSIVKENGKCTFNDFIKLIKENEFRDVEELILLSSLDSLFKQGMIGCNDNRKPFKEREFFLKQKGFSILTAYEANEKRDATFEPK